MVETQLQLQGVNYGAQGNGMIQGGRQRGDAGRRTAQSSPRSAWTPRQPFTLVSQRESMLSLHMRPCFIKTFSINNTEAQAVLIILILAPAILFILYISHLTNMSSKGELLGVILLQIDFQVSI